MEPIKIEPFNELDFIKEQLEKSSDKSHEKEKARIDWGYNSPYNFLNRRDQKRKSANRKRRKTAKKAKRRNR